MSLLRAAMIQRELGCAVSLILATALAILNAATWTLLGSSTQVSTRLFVIVLSYTSLACWVVYATWDALVAPLILWSHRRARKNELKHQQVADNKKVRELMARLREGARDDFVLYLRPFASDRKHKLLVNTLDDFEARHGDRMTFESALRTALDEPTTLISIGRHFGVGPAELIVEDNEWWAHFQLLARQAQAIIIVPSLDGETANEMRWLEQEALLWKTIFVFLKGGRIAKGQPKRNASALVLRSTDGKTRFEKRFDTLPEMKLALTSAMQKITGART